MQPSPAAVPYRYDRPLGAGRHSEGHGSEEEPGERPWSDGEYRQDCRGQVYSSRGGQAFGRAVGIGGD
ncbi:hypothetical protein [Streptomyces sp. MMBL 11-3]|uniref:hypothetical protein n=1 Tax=Streptomyces sp. MMBL 11-3 TaxID=3382639 RepID=UPI0039B57F3C